MTRFRGSYFVWQNNVQLLFQVEKLPSKECFELTMKPQDRRQITDSYSTNCTIELHWNGLKPSKSEGERNYNILLLVNLIIALLKCSLCHNLKLFWYELGIILRVDELARSQVHSHIYRICSYDNHTCVSRSWGCGINYAS